MAEAPPLSTLFCSAGLAAALSEVSTIPLDSVKVRLQVQSVTKAKYSGMMDVFRVVSREEGVVALWNGVSSGVLRHLVFTSIRLGFYEPVRDEFSRRLDNGEVSLMTRVLAAMTTGAVGICVASPADLVKVRLQAQTRGVVGGYTGTFDAFSKIIRSEGVPALWKGIGPNVVRNSVMNAVEVASYDSFKHYFLTRGYFGDNIYLHTTSGLAAGLLATVICSPVDVVKARVMTSPYGPVECIKRMVRQEGVKSFYRGFIPSYCRIGGFNVLMFVFYEQIRKIITEYRAA